MSERFEIVENMDTRCWDVEDRVTDRTIRSFRRETEAATLANDLNAAALATAREAFEMVRAEIRLIKGYIEEDGGTTPQQLAQISVLRKLLADMVAKWPGVADRGGR
jgi:hypothetical protein